ncbi:hypothetical protein HDV06_007125 [Boothiomyces sp. JEL0866]|nr:hypothetical protein HDV06_007125 [Boothiomyces sp. JEL0866]
MAPKILCLHGMAGCKERLQNSLQPLQEILREKYELVYVNAPFDFPKEWLPEVILNSGAPSFNRWFEKCNHLENGETRVVYPGLPPVTVDLDLGPALKRVQEVWDESFVGLFGFSNGSMVAGMVSSLLVPQPKFVLFNGAIPEGMEMFTKTLNCPSLNLMGYSDGNRHEIIRGEGLYETVLYEGGHRTIYDQTTFERIAYWLDALEHQPTYSVEPNNYTLSLFSLNHEKKELQGSVSISFKTLAEIKSLVLDTNSNIRVSAARVACLRTKDNLESVKHWETDETTYRYSQSAAVMQSKGSLDLEFNSTLPGESQFVLYVEFQTDLNEIGGSLQFPCFKWIKSTFTVNIFNPVGTTVDFIEPCSNKGREVINGKEYHSQKYSVSTPIAPGLINFDLKINK